VTTQQSPATENQPRPNNFLLTAAGVAKSFSGVPALRDGTIDLRPGSVHALCGGNGAGKTTFLSILMGIVPRDSGVVHLAGREVNFRSPKQALRAGVSMISQELSPVRGMTVAENLFLGREPKVLRYLVDFASLNKKAAEHLAKLDFPIDPRRRMCELSLAETQLVEIAKALTLDARVLIMDEPTSALGEREAENLFRTIRRLTELGTAIIYVSHRLTEIFRVADEYTVFRDGRFIESGRVADIDRRHLIRQIIGRDLSSQFRSRAATAEVDRTKGSAPLLEIKNLSRPPAFTDISLSLYPGEIVGIYGLLGSGRTEFLEAVFGLDHRASGKIKVSDRPIVPRHPREMKKLGLALVTEDRRASGLVLCRSVRENLVLSALPRMSRFGWMNERRERASAADMVTQLRIRAASLGMPVRNLSGGNQQKVVLGRWLQVQPQILLLDEPTRGIDEGAKHEIYAFLSEFVDAGGAILMVSSEVDEILGMSDRIAVFRRGRLEAELPNTKLSQGDLLHLAS
jgi:putative xylitol transport system ATP-binding protein